MLTAFPDGLNNLPRNHFLAGRDVIGIPYPARWHVFFDDFDKYNAGDWVIQTTEGGSGSATEALTDIDGGVLLITNDNADNDLDFFQSAGECFTFQAGKKLFFETRLKVNEVIQHDFFVGLDIRDTTALAVSDGVRFQSDDGDALLDFHSLVNSVDTSITGIHTMVNDTFVTLAFFWDGVSSILVAINNTVVATLQTTPTATELTVSFGTQAGEATNVKTMSIDWILVCKER